jgi:hypothetical protein
MGEWTRTEISAGLLEITNGEVTVRVDAANLTATVEGTDGIQTTLPLDMLTAAGKLVEAAITEHYGGIG